MVYSSRLHWWYNCIGTLHIIELCFNGFWSRVDNIYPSVSKRLLTYSSVEYVTDPNSTISHNGWVNRWPKYFTSQILPSCQAQDMPISSGTFHDINLDPRSWYAPVFYTNQTAFTYTLTGVWTMADSQKMVVLPALTYLNNPIQNCQVNSVQIELEAEDRRPTQYGWTTWGEVLQVLILMNSQNGLLILKGIHHLQRSKRRRSHFLQPYYRIWLYSSYDSIPNIQ